MTNKIAEIRKWKGLTLEAVAARAGTTSSTVSKLESGRMTLTDKWRQKLAAALEVSPLQLIELPEIAIYAQNLRRYSNPVDKVMAELLADSGQEMFEVIDDALDQVAIKSGAIILAEMVPPLVENIKIGDLVVVRLNETSGGDSVLLLRQFIPPTLLITNSSIYNPPPLSTALHDVKIIGLFRGKRPAPD